ncbi:MAG: hypothetical protein AAFX02_04745 [Pseudomonadota bacterium]
MLGFLKQFFGKKVQEPSEPETTEIIRKYSPEECEAGRRAATEDIVLPEIQSAFDRIPELKSALFFVGQYSNDEARDAVHKCIIYSISGTPDLEAYRLLLKRWDGVKIPGEDEAEWAARDATYVFAEGLTASNLADKHFNPEPNYSPSVGFVEDLSAKSNWDENHSAVPFFAAFSPERMDGDSHTALDSDPYAIFRRAADGSLVIEIIGEMVRPWLDGVPGSWGPF